jgi:hypothetical protein
MNDRWYSVSLQASQLQSLADALQFVTLQSGSPQVTQGAVATSQALLRQVYRHIHNEQTIVDWEGGLSE